MVLLPEDNELTLINFLIDCLVDSGSRGAFCIMQKSKLGRAALIVHHSHVDNAHSHTQSHTVAHRHNARLRRETSHSSFKTASTSNRLDSMLQQSRGPGWPEVWGHSKERPGARIINVY